MRPQELFDAALVALGPPDRIPQSLGKGAIRSGFAEKVQEYNSFVMAAGYVVMPGYSYIEYSRWFHYNKTPAIDAHVVGRVGSPYEPAPKAR